MVRKQYTFEDIEPGSFLPKVEKNLGEGSEVKITYTAEESLQDEPENKQETRTEVRARRAIYKEIKQKVTILIIGDSS